MINIKTLQDDLAAYTKAKKELEEAQQLLSLVGKKGYLDGKWYQYPKLDFQVAYQANCGGKNYHNSQALNKAINTLIVQKWDTLVEEAMATLTAKANTSAEVFEKYYLKD